MKPPPRLDRNSSGSIVPEIRWLGAANMDPPWKNRSPDQLLPRWSTYRGADEPARIRISSASETMGAAVGLEAPLFFAGQCQKNKAAQIARTPARMVSHIPI